MIIKLYYMEDKMDNANNVCKYLICGVDRRYNEADDKIEFVFYDMKCLHSGSCGECFGYEYCMYYKATQNKII